MDELERYDTKRNELDTKGQLLYDSTYMWNLEQASHRDRKQKLLGPGRRKE